eukprot:5666282-Alexandrium_andersonii.AAC.1
MGVADAHSAFWEATDSAHEWHTPAGLAQAVAEAPALPPLSAAEVVSVARSFPVDTAVAADGIHVRHIAMLSDAGLTAVGCFLRAMEVVGMPPHQMELLSYVLLPKPAGGYKGICIFAGLMRIWARCRRPVASAW